MQMNMWPRLGLLWSVGLGLATPSIAPMVAQAQAANFADVPANYWARDYISVLAELNIINGFPDGSFRPDEPVTRAQFAAILRQASLKSEIVPGEPFADVEPSYWAVEAIRLARSSGFLSGYPGNVFKPEQPIPRGQALISLTHGLDYVENNLDVLAYYRDASEIPDYARPGLAAATQSNLVVNYPVLTRLNPNRNATRAEIAAFIYQALVREDRVGPLAATPYVVTTTASSWTTAPSATIPVKAQQVGFSGAGQRLATLTESADLIQIWNTRTGTDVAEIVANDETRFEFVAINEDGTQVAAIVQTMVQTLPERNLELRLWNTETGEQLWQAPLGALQTQFRPAEGEFMDTQALVAFSPGNRGILTRVRLGFDAADRPTGAELRFHDVATGDVLQSLTPTAGIDLDEFEFSADGTVLAGAGYISPDTPLEAGLEAGHVIDVWQLNDGKRLMSLRPDEEDFSLVDMAFAPDGTLKFLTQQFYDIRLDTWNVQTQERVERITELPDIDRTDRGYLSPDGNHYFVRSDVAGTRMINFQNQTVIDLDVYPANGMFTRILFNSTGSHLAISNPENVQIFSQGAQPTAAN